MLRDVAADGAPDATGKQDLALFDVRTARDVGHDYRVLWFKGVLLVFVNRFDRLFEKRRNLRLSSHKELSRLASVVDDPGRAARRQIFGSFEAGEPFESQLAFRRLGRLSQCQGELRAFVAIEIRGQAARAKLRVCRGHRGQGEEEGENSSSWKLR